MTTQQGATGQDEEREESPRAQEAQDGEREAQAAERSASQARRRASLNKEIRAGWQRALGR